MAGTGISSGVTGVRIERRIHFPMGRPGYRDIPMFGKGLLVTFEISIVAQLVGIVIGLIAGLARLSQRRVVQTMAMAYIDFFRGIPLLVTLVWIYYGVALLFEINISAFVAGVSGLGVTLGAYLAEVFRAGVQRSRGDRPRPPIRWG